MTDEEPLIMELVAAAAAGDEAAWRGIVDRYAPLLAAVLRRFDLSQAAREDVAQTVWLRLVEHLGDLREPRALPMWICVTARRECLRQVGQERRVRLKDPADSGWDAVLRDTTEPDEDLLRTERRQALLAGLAELPDRQRLLLVLLIQDPPLSYAEISRRTGIAVGSIGPTRGRALERLRATEWLRSLAAAERAGPDAAATGGGGVSSGRPDAVRPPGAREASRGGEVRGRAHR